MRVLAARKVPDIGYVLAVEDENKKFSIVETDTIPDGVSIPSKDEEHIIAATELEEYILAKERGNYPFLFMKRRDVVEKVKENVANPTGLHFSIGLSGVLLKIAALFEEKPHLVFSFPIYLEYLEKYSLSENDMSVEEFLEKIKDAYLSV